MRSLEEAANFNKTRSGFSERHPIFKGYVQVEMHGAACVSDKTLETRLSRPQPVFDSSS